MHNRLSKASAQPLYHNEAVKLGHFLQTQLSEGQPASDLTYVCIGHGGVHEQIWPGFIFDKLSKQQSVLNIILENGWRYPDSPRDNTYQYMHEELNKQTPEITNGALDRINSNLSVQQFLCGWATSGQPVEEELIDDELRIYPILVNIY